MPAPACTRSSLRARPAPSRQAAMPTDRASSWVSTPDPGAKIWWVSLATGRVAALGGDHASPYVHGSPVRECIGRVDVTPAGSGQHLARQDEGELHDIRGATAGQDLDRLPHLEGVARGQTERGLHV